MKIRKPITVDTEVEVSIGLKEIRLALCEALSDAIKNEMQATVTALSATAWQIMEALTDEMIGSMLKDDRKTIAEALRKTAGRFEKEKT